MAGNLLILGSRQHAKVVAAIAVETGHWHIVGLLDDDPSRHGRHVLDWPVLGNFADLEHLVRTHRVTGLALGVSNRHMHARARWFDRMAQSGCGLPNLIHPRAFVSPFARLGRGVVLNPGVVVNAHARVGDNCVVYSNATIEHETVLADNVYVGPGVNFSSNARVGPDTFIGAGARIVPNVRIGARVVVGAGSVLLQDVPDGVTVAGVPAKILHPSEQTRF